MPQALARGDSTESAGFALRASLLKASPEGEGFHPSQTETLRIRSTTSGRWKRGEAHGKAAALVATPADERNPQFSPDGRWIAYETNESTQFQIVVQSFPTPTAKRQISVNGGVQPRWNATGAELYFIAPDRKLMAATVTASGSAFDAGTPVALFQTRIASGRLADLDAQYAVSRDGRFLINENPDDSAAPITLILNWKPK